MMIASLKYKSQLECWICLQKSCVYQKIILIWNDGRPYSWQRLFILSLLLGNNYNSIQSLQNQANDEHLPMAKIVGETVCYL